MICIAAIIVFSACDDLMEVDSKRLISDEEYGLKSSGDSIYSMFGVLSQLQKLADSYVLLGELRGDLMEVTPESDKDLRDIYHFDIREGNKYVDIKNYYAVINNCNYIMQKIDTNAIDKGMKLQLRHYAAVSSIRAWTYMQMALNFGKVKYYKNPILTVADAEKQYPEMTLDELSDILIPELELIKNVPLPSLGFIDSYYSNYSYFPVRFVLGDLYLWKGQYEKAAQSYYELMFNQRVIIEKNNTSSWVAVNNTISSEAYLYWLRTFTFSSGEVLTTITCPTEYGQDYHLDTLNNQNRIAPTAVALNNWDSQTYYLNEASNAQGDLRKYGSIWYREQTVAPNAGNSYKSESGYRYYIFKYKMYDQNVIVYRSSLLYLRYAEALNRLNKPRLAFAVLKFGLNSTNLFNERIAPVSEKGAPLISYVNFNDNRFINNVGIRMRGLGNMQNDTTFYRLPKLPAMTDSILYVEDLIQRELALETAFEGNRFHDLMRITLRRMVNGESDESYLADIVSAKYANPNEMKQKLMNSDNWYIRK